MDDTEIEKYSADEWDQLRSRFFFNPLMSASEVAKLGQNVGISWPFKGSGETVEKYLEFDFEDLESVPGLVGKKRRIRTLMDILRETLAFDDPFGDMAEAVESDCVDDKTFQSILTQLEVRSDYPMEYVNFSEETKTMLREKGATNLLECIRIGQKLGIDATVGRDLNNFLNALAHKDETGIAKVIPYRANVRGLHLAEAIGLIAENLDQASQLRLLEADGASLSAEQGIALSSEDKETIEASLQKAEEQLAQVCEWFSDEAAKLDELFKSGGAPERYFILINEPRRERLALQLAKMHFGVEEEKEKKTGLFGRMFGRK
jgi:hypothetical protein